MESYDGISLPILNGANYSHWRIKMCRILEAKELDEIVYGSEYEPTQVSSGIHQASQESRASDTPGSSESITASFKKKNARACMHIINALDEKNLTIVGACRLAREIWNRLELEYADREPISLEGLLTEFYTYKMTPGQSVSEYVAHIDMMVLRMAQLKAPMETAAVMAKITTGLTDEFANFKRSWDMTPSEFKSKDLMLTNLRKEEVAMTSDKISGSLLITRLNQKRGNVYQGRRSNQMTDKSNSKCKWCQQIGHWWKECPTRPADKIPSNLGRGKRHHNRNQQVKVGAQNEKSNSAPQDDARLMYHRMLTMKKFSTDEDLHKGDLYCNKTLTEKRTDPQGFYIDSGCSVHLTGKKKWLSDYKPLTKHYPIQVGNGEFLHAVGIGDLDCVACVDGQQRKLRMTEVHYVPGLTENLFSVGAADRHGISITFKDGTACLKDGSNTLAYGSKAMGNLYRLDISFPLSANIAHTRRTCKQWHETLGHADMTKIKQMARDKCVSGMKIIESSQQVDGCGECQAGKARCASHPRSSKNRAKEPLERVHTDLIGKINPPSYSGKSYVLLIKDEYSTFMFVELLTSKAEVSEKLQQFIDRSYTTTQRRIRYMRSDQGSEFENKNVNQICEIYGIQREFSAVYTPEQNGMAERANQTVIGTARSYLYASGLPLELWAEAVVCAAYARNRIPNTNTNGLTPFELYYSHRPDISHMMRFGQPVHIIDHMRYKSKFTPRTREAFMVGYGSRVNTYRCVLKNLKDLVITSDCVPAAHSNRTEIKPETDIVTFTIVPTDHNSERVERTTEIESLNNECLSVVPIQCGTETVDLPEKNTGAQTVQTRSETSTVDVSGTPRENVPTANRVNDTFIVMTRPDFMRRQPNTRATVRTSAQIPGRRDQQGRTKVNTNARQTTSIIQTRAQAQAAEIQAEKLSQIAACHIHGQEKQASKDLTPQVTETCARNLAAVAISHEPEPTSYYEAINGPERNQWLSAIQNELNALKIMETWTVMVKPESSHEISAKWVFKRKLMPDGSIERHKARLVARGFNQIEGLEYGEVFAPVVRIDSIRLLLSLSAQLSLKLFQFDIATAFLNGVINEEIYLKPPEGLDLPDGHTLRLNRSLYGLKQSPRCWGARFREVAASFGMVPTVSDPCVYSRKGESTLYLALYVDDGLLFGASQEDIDLFVNHLRGYFTLNEVRSSCFVGVEIDKHKDGSIFIHQASYIKRMLDRYGMTSCNTASSPLPIHHPLNTKEILLQKVVEAKTVDDYAASIGSLLYCATSTRPDISYALSVLSKYSSEPREAHWAGVLEYYAPPAYGTTTDAS